MRILLLSQAILLAIVLWFFPSSIDREAGHALAVGLLVLILWVAHVLPHAITGLIGCYLFWTLVGVPRTRRRQRAEQGKSIQRQTT